VLGLIVLFLIGSVIFGLVLGYHVFVGMSGAVRDGHHFSTCACQRCHNARVALAVGAATAVTAVALKRHNRRHGGWL
jgi:hypothetical protein